MNTKPIKPMLIRTMYILVILVVVLSVTFVTYTTPVAAATNKLIGDRLNLYYGGSITFPTGEPFHIVHGHAVSSDSDAIGIYDFELEVNGDPQEADFKDFGAESGDPDTLLRRWVFNFPEGMDEETYEFTGHWFEPCQTAVDEGVFTGPCSTPNAKVETYTQTLTVEFTTTPPDMDLRVNYGHDWVESFYQTGHEVSITVTDSNGVPKATAEAMTEQKDYWGGEPGFQTIDSTWFDPDGNPMVNPPDLQPNDWVYAQVDNGRTAEVRIGEISGTIDLANDSIGGTINAPWFSNPVQVECFDWGSGQEPPFDTIQDGSIFPNNSASYSCHWDEWDIQPGQDVGVGYLDPDGNWVANAFFVPMPTFVAYLPYAIEGYDWPIDDIIKIYINDQYIAQSVSEQRPDFPEGTTRVLFDVGQYGVTLQTNDHIMMLDESIDVSKEVWVTNLAVTDFDLGTRQVFGTYTYDPGSESENYLWVWLYDRDGQVPTMNPDGTWSATFDELPPGAWGGATQWDGDGDGTSIDFRVPNPNLYAVPDENKIYAQEWIAGIQLDLKIYNSDGNIIHSDSQVVESPSEVPWTVVVFDYDDLSPGQRIVLGQRGYERELLVSSLMITSFDLVNQQVKGTGDAGAQIFIRINSEDVWGEVDSDGIWAISHPQLDPGVWGEAIQPDGVDGDETRDGFQAPFE